LPLAAAVAIFPNMTGRRYADDEIAAIFGAAAESPESAPQPAPSEQGLTLADLQAIGREVGISPDAVAQAAQTIDVRRAAVSRTFLGLPIGVERAVTLSRRLTDEEWERLVVELREVFKARGTTRSDGSLRQWTNGNLYALLEPVAAGYRLRLGSLHGAARARITAGLAALGVTATLALSSAISGHLGDAVPGIVLLLTAGLGMAASGALPLPGWVRLRGRQMEALAARLALSAGSPDPPPPALPPGSGIAA
jgi:hypothetical protein